MDSMKVALAPEQLWQSINPWKFYQQGAQFGFINIDLGSTPRPDIEQVVLDEVGSYGRQLGRLGDALEVLLARLDRATLTPAEADAVKIAEGQLADVRKIKARQRDAKPD